MRQVRNTDLYGNLLSRPIAIFVLYLLALLLGFPEHGAAQIDDVQNGRFLTVEIAGNTLRIPRNYFQGPPPSAKPDGLFMTALMPNMEPMRQDNKNEFLYTRGFGNKIHLLLEDQGRSTTIEFRLNVSKKLAAPIARGPDRYGLQAYLPIPSDAAHKGSARQEIYIEEQAGSPVSYITCILDGTVPWPSCSEEFTYRGFLVQVTYGKPHLPKWHEIQRATTSLIDRFIQQS